MPTLPKEVPIAMIMERNLKTARDLHLYLKDTFKDALQEMLEAELDYAKGGKKNKQTGNRRNGYSQKTVKTQFREIPIEVPRDRNGEFELIVVPKNNRDILGTEEKVISLYARGMSTRDIHDQLKEIYGIELSAEMVRKITNRILPQIKKWQNRPLESIYPFCFYGCYSLQSKRRRSNKKQSCLCSFRG